MMSVIMQGNERSRKMSDHIGKCPYSHSLNVTLKYLRFCKCLSNQLGQLGTIFIKSHKPSFGSTYLGHGKKTLTVTLTVCSLLHETKGSAKHVIVICLGPIIHTDLFRVQ